jgi:hypothetical protein
MEKNEITQITISAYLTGKKILANKLKNFVISYPFKKKYYHNEVLAENKFNDLTDTK